MRTWDEPYIMAGFLEEKDLMWDEQYNTQHPARGKLIRRLIKVEAPQQGECVALTT